MNLCNATSGDRLSESSRIPEMTLHESTTLSNFSEVSARILITAIITHAQCIKYHEMSLQFELR